MIKLLVLVTFLISESVEEPASVSCQRELRVIFGSERYIPGGGRYKCTFSNVNSFDEMKAAISSSLDMSNADNIVSITFNQSNIAEFPDRMLSNFQNLRSLDGSNLRLGTISSSSFQLQVSALEFINLSFNLITSLSSKVFANRKLKYLDLSNNLIASIDESAFNGCEVEKINLASNKIKDLLFVNGFKFFNLLQMNNNEVEKFSDVKLTPENWSGSRDSFLGRVFPTVNLESNKLKTFECKSTLKFVLIEIKNNPKLKNLDLGGCMINQLDVSDCGNLKDVKLSDNLVGFTAKNVKFDQIDLSRAGSLESLKLTNNSLKADAIQAIMKLENLTTLDISYNTIGPLNISTFSKLKKLSSLGLKATNISDIQFGTFSHQSGVRVLDISDNSLESFDMQMIFSMGSLTYLDLSGNELIELSNIEAAHNTFALLEKIDLTSNKWTCSYLLRLIKIMRAYRVTLIHSYVEEHKSNINGIYCRHIAGDDNIIEPLSPDSSNITDVRNKMNEIVDQLTKESQYRQDMVERLSTLENRPNNQLTIAPSNDALRSNVGSEGKSIEVQNSTLFEMTLVVALCCFIVFISLKMIILVRTNFFGRPRPMRVGVSEHTLTINEDY